MNPLPPSTPIQNTCPTERALLKKAQQVMLHMLRAIDAVCEAHGIRYWIDGGTLLGAVRHKGFIPWDDDIDIAMLRADYEKFLSVAPDALPENLYIQTNELDSNYLRYGMPCKVRDKYSIVSEINNKKDNEMKPMGLFVDIIPIDKFHSSWLWFKRDYTLKWIYRKLCAFPNATLIRRVSIRAILNNLAVHLRPLLRSRQLLIWYRGYLRKGIIRRNEALHDEYLVGYGFDSYWIRFFKPDDIFPLQKIAFEGHLFYAPANTDAVLRTFYGDYMRIPPENERKPSHLRIIEIDIRPHRNHEAQTGAVVSNPNTPNSPHG